MTMKTVVLGVTGSIAAYKACDLASKMTAEGICVHAVMTASAVKLVAPASFQALTGNPVVTSMFHEASPGEMPHISLADVCDLLVVAPATANIIGKFASGIADDMLSTLALSVECPRLVAPAMNPRMWANPIVSENVEKLKKHGFAFIGPEEGRTACGVSGRGRMSEPADILLEVQRILRGT